MAKKRDKDLEALNEMLFNVLRTKKKRKRERRKEQEELWGMEFDAEELDDEDEY